jgi:hypothetical protein
LSALAGKLGGIGDPALMVRALLAALLVGYLPGALLFRIPVDNRRLRAALPAEERVFWAIVLSVVWSVIVVLALAALGRYSFDRLLATNGVLSLLIALAGRQHLRLDEAPRPTWSALPPLALVAIGSWLYFPTAEYVIGGKDPGTLLNEGVQMAQSGQMVLRDEDVASVPPAFRDLFFPAHLDQRQWYYGIRFMGFFIQDPSEGQVIGQFPHLFPASIAIGYGLHGLTGARQAVAAWATLGLVAIYFAGARIFGRTAAFAAAALVAINVAEVWFARYPNSEVVMQGLLFAALLAFGRALDGSRTFFGSIAGVLLGLLLFVRYEVVLAFATFGAAATLAPVTKRRVGLAFVVALVASAVIGLWYLLGPLRAYAAYPLGFTRDRGGWWLVGACVLLAWLARRLLRVEAIAAATRRALPLGMALLIAALAIYAYFFRQEGGKTALHDAMAFRTFGWYLTPWVLAVTVLAVVVVTLRRFWRDPAFFLTISVISVFFFYKTRIVPEHFWSARRFLAVSLPGSLLCLAACADDLVDSARRWLANGHRANPAVGEHRWQPIVAVSCVLLVLTPVAITFWGMSSSVRGHVEYAGLIPQLEKLASRIGDRDLLIVESRNAGSDLHVLAVPLAYIYGKHVLVLDSPVPPKRQIEDFVAWARSRYEAIYFLGGGGTDLLTKHMTAEAIVSTRFPVPEYDSPVNAYPAGVRRKDFEFGLYRLTPATALPGPVRLTIGRLDDLHVVRFYAKETRAEDGMAFRWSRRTSYVLLLGITAQSRQVTIWMSNGGRPSKAPPAAVEVAFGEQVAGTVAVDAEMRPYSFRIPPEVATRAAATPDPIRLRLQVATWNPAQLLGGTDNRDLGVMVTRVEVE